MEESLKVGLWGHRRPPVWCRDNVLCGGQGAKPPKAEQVFFSLNLRYENPHFLALYLVSNSHSQNTFCCALTSSRGTNQAMPLSGGQGAKHPEDEGFF